MSSKFRVLPIFIAAFITFSSFFLLYICLVSQYATMVLPILFLLFVVYFWLTEFRTRAHKLTIDNDTVCVNRLFGLGKSVFFDLKTLEGFETSIQSGKSGSFEFLFVIKNGKRVACISAFYHSNYDELKKILEKKIINFGEKEYNFKREYNQMFK